MSEIIGYLNGSARSAAIQAKLTVGQPADAQEQEADRVANAAMRMPANGQLSRPFDSIAGPRGSDCAPRARKRSTRRSQVQRKEQAADTPPLTSPVAANIQNLRGGGSALPARARAFFEPRFARISATCNCIPAREPRMPQPRLVPERSHSATISHSAGGSKPASRSRRSDSQRTRRQTVKR